MARRIESTDLPEGIARAAEARVAAGLRPCRGRRASGVDVIASMEQKRVALRAALADGELSGLFEGDSFESVRLELGLKTQ